MLHGDTPELDIAETVAHALEEVVRVQSMSDLV